MERRWETRDSKIGVIREVESGKTLAQVSHKTYNENARIGSLRGWLDGCMRRMGF